MQEPPRVTQTRSRVALAAIQGFLSEFFTTDDQELVDDTFVRFIDGFLLAPFTGTDKP